MPQVIQGDALAVLRGLPSESVNLCATSPPYMAKRKYGCPTIYGGDDPNCEHEWGEEIAPVSNGASGVHSGDRKRVAPTLEGSHKGQWCQRCSAWRGEMGLEPTIESYLSHLWVVFDEVYRVLRKDGVCFVNLGDSYGGSWGEYSHRHQEGHLNKMGRMPKDVPPAPTRSPSKSLLLIPERFILGMTDPQLRPALSKGLAPAVDHAWIARNKNVWHKPNPMPESVRDRFSCTWEPVFYFAKSQKVWFDLDSVRRPWHPNSIERQKRHTTRETEHSLIRDEDTAGWEGRLRKHMADHCTRAKTADEGLFKPTLGQADTFDVDCAGSNNAHQSRLEPALSGRVTGMRQAPEPGEPNAFHPLGANPGDFFIDGDDDWWEIPSQPRKESHFATFPDELAKRMILVGCPEWVCRKCGMARVRVSKQTYETPATRGSTTIKRDKKQEGYRPDAIYSISSTTTGWTTCSCDPPEWRPGVVLDPFAGRGTVGIIAKRYGRESILIELKEEYVRMIEANLAAEPEPMRLEDEGHAAPFGKEITCSE